MWTSDSALTCFAPRGIGTGQTIVFIVLTAGTDLEATELLQVSQ